MEQKIRNNVPKNCKLQNVKLISHNINSSTFLFEFYLKTINKNSIVCLQDIGISYNLTLNSINFNKTSNTFLFNTSPTNVSRSVAILLGSNWNVVKSYKNNIGSIISVIIFSNETFLCITSVYLPPGLDSPSVNIDTIKEANSTYLDLTNWINKLSKNINWIVSGDLNETRTKSDRIWTQTKQGYYFQPDKERLIDNFLCNVKGTDIWRSLHSNSPGHTRYGKKSSARLDYWIMNKVWFKIIKYNIDFQINHQEDYPSDHRAIILTIPLIIEPNLFNIPFRIKKPRLPDNGISIEKLIEINEKWNRKWETKIWNIETINEFTKHIRTEIGDIYGYSGGPAFNKMLNENHQNYTNMKELKYVGSLIRSIAEHPQHILIERWKQMLIIYLNNLKKKFIIPNDMNMSKTYSWCNKNLKNKIIEIKFKMKNEDNTKSYYDKEKILFYNIKERSKWLSFIGMGKERAKISPFLITKDLSSITNPVEIKNIYYNSFSNIFKDSFKFNQIINIERKINVPKLTIPRPFYNLPLPDYGNKPLWWNRIYHKSYKNISINIWDDLIKQIDLIELNNTIKEISGDLSADIEGNHSNLTKQAFQTNSPLNVHLCNIFNEILINEEIPSTWKEFYVSLIPKNGNGNTAEALVDTNRPISICNDYLKLFQKIMATRLNNIILKHKILHPAQQGFIKNGSINTCLSTLLNILEDQKQKNILKNSNFYLISYDLTKAYDSIQFCSLRPSLERFNLPEKFIKLMENIIFKMTGSIKTFFGLTEKFEVNKSIRQGDPMAPLLFVLWIDALHDGISFNPYISKKMGYKFLSHHQRIASLGFADDIIIFAETWNDIYITHEWVKDFIHTHGGKINQNKTAYIISNGIENDKRWLHNCSGNEQIIPAGKDKYFKYLGLNINLELDWSKQIQIMNGSILV